MKIYVSTDKKNIEEEISKWRLNHRNRNKIIHARI